MAQLCAYKYKPQINDIRLLQQLDVYVCVRIFALPKYLKFDQRHAQILSISLTEHFYVKSYRLILWYHYSIIWYE